MFYLIGALIGSTIMNLYLIYKYITTDTEKLVLEIKLEAELRKNFELKNN